MPSRYSAALGRGPRGAHHEEDLRGYGRRCVGGEPPERELVERAAVGRILAPSRDGRPFEAGGGLLRDVRSGLVAEYGRRRFLGACGGGRHQRPCYGGPGWGWREERGARRRFRGGRAGRGVSGGGRGGGP